MNIEETKTLKYYTENALDFTNNTQNIEFSFLQNLFLSFIPKKGKILDLGCGAGRDSKYFKQKGHVVVAVDGCPELCDIARKHIEQEVICQTFDSFIPNDYFDGIWACSSLLHLKYEDIKQTIKKYADFLNKNGCFYMSFKYGTFSGMRNGRYFTDLTEEIFKKILQTIPTLELKDLRITSDIRPNRQEEKWLNVFLIKKS